MEGTLNYSTSDLDHTPVKSRNDDNFEDAKSEIEIITEDFNLAMAESTIKISSQISITDVYEKNIYLENSYKDAMRKCEVLQNEIDVMNATVNRERQRAHSYKKKLQYIQENQDILKSLKETYISYKGSKCNEGEKIPKDAVTQTHHQNQHEINREPSESNPCIVMSVTELDDIKNTFQNLRTLVESREESRTLMLEQQAAAILEITALKEEIRFLKLMLQLKETSETSKTNMASQNTKDTGVLRKIIIKLHKILKDAQYKSEAVNPLTDFEKTIMNLLVINTDTKNALRRTKRSSSLDEIHRQHESVVKCLPVRHKKTIFYERKRIPKVTERRSQSLSHI